MSLSPVPRWYSVFLAGVIVLNVAALLIGMHLGGVRGGIIAVCAIDAPVVILFLLWQTIVGLAGGLKSPRKP